MDDITLYMWATPNSRRISILFEELNIEYSVRRVNIRAQEQFDAQFLALNPFGKVPVVTYSAQGSQHALFESGAILIAFAEAHQSLLPSEFEAKNQVMRWLMVILTALGPLSGQAHHWSALADNPSRDALRHYVAMVERVYRLLDTQLESADYLANEFSIADIAAYPWISASDWTTLSLIDYPNLARWYTHLSKRPSIIRGMALPKDTCLGE